MITSIFNKSKPINYIIVFVITVIAFITARKNLIIDTITIAFVLKQIAILGVCVLTILVFNFIVSKNKLTQTHNFEIVLFSLFLLAIAQATTDVNILISNLLVLLGLRRIISLRSQKNIKNKLFDAALFVAIASVFYFWAILFFITILYSLIVYTNNNIKHWIIPFMGVGAVFSVFVGASVIFYNDLFEIFKASRNVNYDYSPYNSTRYLIAITMLISFGIWSSLFYLESIRRKKKELRGSYKIINMAAILAFVIILLAPNKDGSEFLFLFAPLSLIIINYIEIVEDKWFKEIFLSVLMIGPFLLLML